MRYSALTLLVPCALVLSACTTTVTPAFKDIGTRSGLYRGRPGYRGATVL